MALFYRYSIYWLVVVLAFSAAAQATPPDYRLRVARAYGYREFNRLEYLRFTINVDDGGQRVARSWRWLPHLAEGETVEWLPGAESSRKLVYHTSDLLEPDPGDAKIREINRLFVNDIYWLLYPYKLVEGYGLSVRPVIEPVRRPSGVGYGKKVVITYSPEVSDTPGAVYELYLGKGDRISEWLYRKNENATPSRHTFWENHARIGPYLLSLNRPAPDGSFRVWFTDIEVKLFGSKKVYRHE